MHVSYGAVVLALVLAPSSACGSATTSAPSPSAHGTTRSPCDPGGGFPRSRPGCPDQAPETGWLHSRGDRLRITPFRTYLNDAEGQAYAEAHHLEYPFSDDHHDARTGPAHALAVDPATVCTGSIRAGGTAGQGDRVVTCAELARAASEVSLPVAVWRDGDRVVQVSELYRP